MSKPSPSSPATGDEPAGSRLIAFAVATVVTAGVGNLMPIEAVWRWPLITLTIMAVVCGMRPTGRRWQFFILAGVCLGLAACAWAPRFPGKAGTAIPVRFVVSVRDGWSNSSRGWRTRVRVEELEWAGKPMAQPSNLAFYLAASVEADRLPEPGTRWMGSGELVGDRRWRLAPASLRVKTLLLLERAGTGPLVDRLRQGAVVNLNRAAGDNRDNQRAAGLAAALVLGRQESIEQEDLNALRRSGLAHLLAVSGLNVGFVAAMVWGLLNLFNVRPHTRRWLVIPAIIGFAALAGGDAPVRRAAGGGVVYLLGRQLGRPLLSLPIAWAVVAFLTVLDPAALLQPGFQLSAGVALALVRWVVPISERLKFLPNWAAQALAVAVTAQVASMPLIGQHFVGIAPLSLFANILAAPVAFALMVVSVLAVLIAPVSSLLASGALCLIAMGQALLGWAATIGGAWNLNFPPLPVVLIIGAALLSIAALLRVQIAGSCFAALAVLPWLWMILPPFNNPVNEIRMLRVGDGMALLVRSKTTSVLIDSGRSPVEAWRELARLRVKRLTALVVTHGDEDHVGGAKTIIERVRVDCLVYARADGARPGIEPLRQVAALWGVKESPLETGQKVEIGDLQLTALWPPGELLEGGNDASLVIRLEGGGVRMLLTGDIEHGGERALLALGNEVGADILQLAHHGSATSSTEEFLKAVHPKIALAATGLRPRYSYPNPVVVKRVRAIPGVLVDQKSGFESIWWESPDRLIIEAAQPVFVPLRIRNSL